MHNVALRIREYLGSCLRSFFGFPSPSGEACAHFFALNKCLLFCLGISKLLYLVWEGLLTSTELIKSSSLGLWGHCSLMIVTKHPLPGVIGTVSVDSPEMLGRRAWIFWHRRSETWKRACPRSASASPFFCRPTACSICALARGHHECKMYFRKT